jgi:hypothetical protein
VKIDKNTLKQISRQKTTATIKPNKQTNENENEKHTQEVIIFRSLVALPVH